MNLVWHFALFRTTENEIVRLIAHSTDQQNERRTMKIIRKKRNSFIRSGPSICRVKGLLTCLTDNLQNYCFRRTRLMSAHFALHNFAVAHEQNRPINLQFLNDLTASGIQTKAKIRVKQWTSNYAIRTYERMQNFEWIHMRGTLTIEIWQ